MDGKIKDIAFDAIAPTMLNTSSMSYTETDIAIIIANKMIVYMINNTFAWFLRFTLS